MLCVNKRCIELHLIVAVVFTPSLHATLSWPSAAASGLFGCSCHDPDHFLTTTVSHLSAALITQCAASTLLVHNTRSHIICYNFNKSDRAYSYVRELTNVINCTRVWHKLSHTHFVILTTILTNIRAYN